MRVPKLMYNSKCNIYPHTGDTPEGESFGEPILNVDCRIEEKMSKRVTKDADGAIIEYLSKGKGFIDLNGITLDSKIIVNETTFYVAEVGPLVGFTFSHSEVILK